jgi:DNA polymerase-3 subunit epsilon
MERNFCAIDFETACNEQASACTLGMVRVRNGEVAETFYSLIKPPAGMEIWASFTDIHGITMNDVRNSPTFAELWPQIKEFIQSDVLVAHNAGFDKGVLVACLEYYGIEQAIPPFECTVQCSRKAWKKEIDSQELINCKLNTVSAFLGIELNHHEALSDALACAKIYLEAQK